MDLNKTRSSDSHKENPVESSDGKGPNRQVVGGPDTVVASNAAGVQDSGIRDARKHPSRSLEERKSGFGIGGGYEKPYRRRETARTDNRNGLYAPIPHAGY